MYDFIITIPEVDLIRLILSVVVVSYWGLRLLLLFWGILLRLGGYGSTCCTIPCNVRGVRETLLVRWPLDPLEESLLELLSF